MDVLLHLNHSTQLFGKLAHEQLTNIPIWSIINLTENYPSIIYNSNLPKCFYIFAFIVCVDLVIPEWLLRHKGVIVHVIVVTMHKMCDGEHPIRKVAGQIQLRSVSKSISSRHNRILTWCYRVLWEHRLDRSTRISQYKWRAQGR